MRPLPFWGNLPHRLRPPGREVGPHVESWEYESQNPVQPVQDNICGLGQKTKAQRQRAAPHISVLLTCGLAGPPSSSILQRPEQAPPSSLHLLRTHRVSRNLPKEPLFAGSAPSRRGSLRLLVGEKAGWGRLQLRENAPLAPRAAAGSAGFTRNPSKRWRRGGFNATCGTRWCSAEYGCGGAPVRASGICGGPVAAGRCCDADKPASGWR